MATYAPTTHAAVASTDDYLIGFPYAQPADVKVYLEGVEVDFGTATDEWSLDATGTKISFGATVGHQDDDVILIKRVTDISGARTTFTRGAGFTAVDGNAAINQLLYSIDELQVPAFDSGFLSCADLVTGAVDIDQYHRLGTWPTRIQIQYKCTASELGYLTGAVITGEQVLVGGTFPFVETLVIHNFETMNDLTIFSTTGSATQATLSKWSYRILAWR
jgi:hypothetical protein